MTGEEERARRGAGSQGDEADLMSRLEEEIRNMPVADHVVYMLRSFSAMAMGRLGLTPDSVGQTDPAQARLAIEGFKALMGVLEPVRPAGEMAAHRGVLAQLQLAYAGAMNAGVSREEVAESPGEPASVAQAGGEEAPVDTEAPVGTEAPDAAMESEPAAASRSPRPRKSSQKGA